MARIHPGVQIDDLVTEHQFFDQPSIYIQTTRGDCDAPRSYGSDRFTVIE